VEEEEEEGNKIVEEEIEVVKRKLAYCRVKEINKIGKMLVC